MNRPFFGHGPNAQASGSAPGMAGSLRNALIKAWQARTPRERRGLALAAALIAAALLWQLVLAPALQTWRQAPALQARLDTERQQLLALQQQARQLQTLPRIGRDEALRWLQGPELAALGPGASVRLQGEQVLVQLQAAPAEGLSRWLRAAREQARALPVQVQLQQSDAALTAGQRTAGATANLAPNPATNPAPLNPAAGALARPSAAPDRTSPADPASLRWRGSLVLSLPA